MCLLDDDDYGGGGDDDDDDDDYYDNSNSNVRHPRCVLYNSKQLVMLTSNTNIVVFITRSLQQRHVSALYVGHHQVVVGLSV